MSAPEPHSSQSSEIAHVLFMDIVAYSTLPTGQQQRLLEELNNAVRNTPQFIRASSEDRLIRLPTGDGMVLVFFRDPEAPVRCALELSQTLLEHPEIRLRMGIHTGPVYRVADINATLNVAGGGINVAQRVIWYSRHDVYADMPDPSRYSSLRFISVSDRRGNYSCIILSHSWTWSRSIR